MDAHDCTLERRRHQRYPLHLPVRSISGRPIGFTADMSSKAIAIACPEGVPVDSIALDWPVSLEDGCGLRLLVDGRVIRRDAAVVVLAIKRYEFHTRRAVAQVA